MGTLGDFTLTLQLTRNHNKCQFAAPIQALGFCSADQEYTAKALTGLSETLACNPRRMNAAGCKGKNKKLDP